MVEKIIAQLKSGQNFIKFSAVKILGSGISFVVPLLIAKILSPEKFGSYSLAMMVVYFFSGMLIHSSQGPLIVYAGEELNERQKVNRTMSARIILFGIAALVVLLSFALLHRQIAQFASVELFDVLFLLIAFAGLTFRSLFEAAFLALGERLRYVKIGLVNSIVAIIYLVSVHYTIGLSLRAIFFMFFVSPVLTILLSAHKLDWSKILPFEFHKETFMKMFNFTKWIILGSAAVYLINWGDNFVLRFYVTLVEIGVYNLGYQMFKGTLVLISIINLYFLPVIARNITNTKKMKQYWNNKRPKLLVLGTIALVGLYFFIPVFIHLVYGNKYEGSILAGQILLIAAFAQFYKSFFSPIFSTLKRYKFMQAANAITMVINIGLNLVLIQYYGIVGAAVASAASFVFLASLYHWYFTKYCRKQLLQGSEMVVEEPLSVDTSN